MRVLPTTCISGPSTVECMNCGRKHMVCGTIAAVVLRIEEERDQAHARLAKLERVAEAARAYVRAFVDYAAERRDKPPTPAELTIAVEALDRGAA